jgi:protein TonB
MSTMNQSALGLPLEDALALQAPASVTVLGHELVMALFGGMLGSPPASPAANARRRRLGPALIVLISAVLHALLAVSVARARPGDIHTFKPHARIRITVTRPPEPIKSAEVPLAVVEPPRRRPPPVAKKKLLAPEPQPVHAAEPPPPPDEPVLAKTEATDPGAVVGAVDGSLTGTGVAGGARGGTGVALPPALAPTLAPVPVVQAHEGAGYLKNPRPPYPDLAQRRGWEGEVMLRVRVSPSGQVEGANVKTSSGRELLDEAAIAAVRGWTFVPARRGSTPIAGWVEVPIVFKLQ